MTVACFPVRGMPLKMGVADYIVGGKLKPTLLNQLANPISFMRSAAVNGETRSTDERGVLIKGY